MTSYQPPTYQTDADTTVKYFDAVSSVLLTISTTDITRWVALRFAQAENLAFIITGVSRSEVLALPCADVSASRISSQ